MSGEKMNILDSLVNARAAAQLDLSCDEINLPGDLETPVSAFLKLRPLGARFLLESAEDPAALGRYTFIGINPLLTLELTAVATVIKSAAQTMTIPHGAAAPFDGIRQLLGRFTVGSGRSDLPLLGGLVGFASYEIVQFFEPRLRGLLTSSAAPLGRFFFVDTLLVFDHFLRRMTLLRLHNAREQLAAGSEPVALEQIRAALRGPIPRPSLISRPPSADYLSNFSPAQFEQMVGIAQKHIFRGDIFQTVLSRQEERPSAADGFHIYRALRMLNPSPYMFYLDFDDIELIGSSPEAMVKLQGRQAMVRPIAGTRRRGRTIDDDRRLADELLHNDKERAEHVMLVDLGRNDLGRVCDYGSVRVTGMMHLERYSHVMHLTSTVTGMLRSDCTAFDLFRSAFPAGTVSGAPKLRAMEIIAELEHNARGPYAGAVGYFSLSGELDMCITIRTIIKQAGRVRLQAGAGIVADSVPEQEFLETANKIAALREAVRIAEEELT